MARTQQDENEPPITGKKEIRERAFAFETNRKHLCKVVEFLTTGSR